MRIRAFAAIALVSAPSAAPAVRYLALCRWNQGGPVLQVTDPRVTCR